MRPTYAGRCHGGPRDGEEIWAYAPSLLLPLPYRPTFKREDPTEAAMDYTISTVRMDFVEVIRSLDGLYRYGHWRVSEAAT